MTDTSAALTEFDRTLLREYSVRTLHALERHRSIRLVMPLFQKIMWANVDKEFDKDRMVIETGVTAAASGASPADVDTDALFGRTRDVDRTFIQKLSGLPVTLDLHYERIRPVRIRRIERLLEFVFKVCRGWQPTGGMTLTVRTSFEPDELQEALSELLHLYAQETRFVCDGARLRGPARLVGRILSDRVAQAMQSVKDNVAEDVRRRIYASDVGGVHRSSH